jgi:large subunit ribosomal protein L10
MEMSVDYITDFFIYMLTKTQKKKVIEDLADKIKRQHSLVFTDISGVNVSEIQKLRRGLRQAGIEYRVAKKTLINLALKQVKQETDISQLVGSLGLAFSYDDPISPAKIIFKFAKEHKNLKVLGGIMENRFLTFEEVKALSVIPTREELLAKLVWSIKGPIPGFINVLAGNIRNLIGVLDAIKNSPR